MSETPKTPEEEQGGAESPRPSDALPVRSAGAAWPGAAWTTPSDSDTIRLAGGSLAALGMSPDPSSMFSTERLLGQALTGRIELDALAPLTSAIEEAGRVSASLRGVLNRSGLAQSPFTALDAGLLPDRLSALITSLGSASLPGTRLAEFAALGRFNVGSALAPLATAPFSDAIKVTGLADLGASYDRVLSSISASTSALFQQTLQVPDLSALVQREVGVLSDAFTTAAGSSLAFDPAGTLRVMPDWASPALFSTVTGLMTKPAFSEDVAEILSGFDRLATWPAGRSVVESMLGSTYVGTMGVELQAELPAVIRRAAAAPPVLTAEIVTPSGDTRFVQLAVAWIQAWSARQGIILSAEATLLLVVSLAVAWATIASSTGDADRVIEAQRQASREIVAATDRQTEAIERLSIPPPTESTHLVTEHVQVRATPSPDATCVGHAYPNQWVTMEGEEAGWSRITFEDRIAGQTRAGWVPSEALRENVVSFEPPSDAESDTSVP